ncbi:hypothetical protein FRB94_010225 [Tulasnella sp. JGI-2019a]|nr:hypothetical protein FRB93_005317 [Tulasnella sp. JGI-2019a]KAG8993989.1 hypothetical protein FRB94_010225 [Tulasnella sp. JGI-2019a]KAG9022943.1 hypothetical protein FRB95_013940 [Tulasnella sp. JGI-2019a]
MSQSTALLGGAVVGLTAWKYYQHVRSSGSLPSPPGPKGDPIIGNLRQMPSDYAWLTFAEWGRKYGPVTYLNVAGQPVLIINAQEAAVDLLDKRSAIYSDRPRFVMAEMSGQDASTALISGAEHRKHRKLFAQALHSRVVERDFVPLQERMSRQLAKCLLDNPDNFYHILFRNSGELIQTVTYGDFTDGHTDLVDLGAANVKNFAHSISGYTVDFVPWLRYLPDWFPGTRFKQDAKRFSELAHDTIAKPFGMVKNQMSAGTAPRCFVSSALEANQAEEKTIADAAFTLFGAGSESTAGTVSIFVLAMTIYPEIQAKARAELDRVFGDSLPTVAYRDSTPYLNAILLETMRWNPIFPLGIPHKLTQDDIYNGYHLAAGTMVIYNAWGILHDERQFSDPMVFDPDRFFSPSESSRNASISPKDVQFGYGRRICQGIAFVEPAAWVFMATILLTFEITPKIDPITMKPMVPEPLWEKGMFSPPKPFKCDIKPRSKEHADRIREAVA